MITHYFKINEGSNFIKEYQSWFDESRHAIQIYITARDEMREIFGVESMEFYMTPLYLQIDLTDKDRKKFEAQIKNDGSFRKNSKLAKKWLELTAEVSRRARPALQLYINNYPLYGKTSSHIFNNSGRWYGSVSSSYQGDFIIPDWLEEIQASEFHKALEFNNEMKNVTKFDGN